MRCAFLFALAIALAGTLAAPPLVAGSPRSDSQQQTSDELARLRALLAKPGPDGKDARESAVTQLLAMAEPEAHQLLQERLGRADDPDGLRIAILRGLHRHLLGNPAKHFGGARPAVSHRIVTGYLRACLPLWRSVGATEVQPSAERTAAGRALRRVPARQLEAAAVELLDKGATDERVALLRCLADMQQSMLAGTIAGRLEDDDRLVRDAARMALQLLVYADEPIRTAAEFAAWRERFGSWSYVQLAERAARNGLRAQERLRDDYQRLRIAAAREFVTVHVQTRPGIDWNAVQERTVSGGPLVFDACLEALQAVLVSVGVIDGVEGPRHAFFSVLLERYRGLGDASDPTSQRRRALLLEVAAYLLRPDEAERVAEIRALLVAQLDSPSVANQLAALRGLRRFPSPSVRQTLVQRALRQLDAGAEHTQQLQVTLDTLAARTEPRWRAPSPDAADKADWLRLIDRCCRAAPELDLRARALLLAQTSDAGEQRVPEAFPVLLALSRDGSLDTELRSTCLIYLEAWRTVPGLAKQWLDAVHALLADPESALRLRAAESLVRLPESTDEKRGEWLQTSLAVLRDRLPVEADKRVFQALVDCAKTFGREPSMPDRAIETFEAVLQKLGQPVDEAQQFRLEPLLQALATIAADTNSRRWLEACESLLVHGKRSNIRLVLQNHNAAELAQHVASSDGQQQARARRAMQVLIETAALRPPQPPWSDTPALQSEARNVRTAFGALLAAKVNTFDEPRHRLLRLAVELAGGKNQDVIRLATRWLAEGPESEGITGYRDRIRLYAAEAELALGHPRRAVESFTARVGSLDGDPHASDVGMRIARALVQKHGDEDLQRVVELTTAVLRATKPEDPTFRQRLLDWTHYSIRLDPKSRPATLAEARKHAALFESAECPDDLREAYRKLQEPN